MTIIDFNRALRPDQLEAKAKRDRVDADDIRERLHSDPLPFIQWMFSGRAIVSKKEARIGNTAGEAGESLAIALAGQDAGLWHDHATGEGGNLIDLYMAYMGYSGGKNFQLALKEIAREFFNDPIELTRTQWQKPVAERIEEKKRKLGDKPKQENIELGAPIESYPYKDRAGNVLTVIRRYEPGGVDERGRPNKTFRASNGFPNPRPLYRVPEIIQATHVVLVEGERKADALASVGIEATTAMGGANTKIEMVDWSPLAGKVVTIWPDKDGPGEEYARRVAPVLSNLGCQVGIITPPIDKPAKWDAYDCIQDGDDPHLVVSSACPSNHRDSPGRYRFLDIDDIEALPPPDWLINNILTMNGLSVLWGRSGDMKSFVALDMGLCVSVGAPWHGTAVKPGLVLYVAAEGSYGLARRAVGWRRTRGRDLPKPQFKIIPHNIALASADLDQLVQQIQQLTAKPILIIIDTLARTFGAGDENKQADMNAYVSAADRLRELTGAHVMIVHHTGVHADKRERGSNVLRGAADTMIKVQRNGDRLAIINRAPEGKQKDAEEFKTINLVAKKVAYEANGTEQTTLILNLDEEAPAEPARESKAKPLGRVEEAVLRALKKAKDPLGFTRLKVMTNANSGSITRALGTLEERGLVSEIENQDGTSRLWRLQ